MKIKGPLKKAIFIDRPNRFLTRLDLEEAMIESHLPDPGRLRELLYPGAEVMVRPVPESSKRKTRFDTVMVIHQGILISLVSSLPNAFAKELLIQKKLSFLKDLEYIRPEVTTGKHRFDHLLEDKLGDPYYLEVKSVTYVKDRIAKFPDAVTARGRSHVQSLGEICKKGGRAGILFVCQRPDADKFSPMYDIDPGFSKALTQASADGLNIWCITANVTELEMTFYKEIPVYLQPLQ